MLNLWTRHWWILVLRGALAIAFGLLALIWPTITWHILIILFGIYVLFDGLFTLFSALRRRRKRGWGFLLLEAFAGIGVAILALVWPRITGLALLYLIAGWALVTGALQIAIALVFREILHSEWVLGIGGLFSIILGLLVAFYPISGVVAIAWLIGLYAILSGLLFILLGLRVRSLHRTRARPLSI